MVLGLKGLAPLRVWGLWVCVVLNVSCACSSWGIGALSFACLDSGCQALGVVEWLHVAPNSTKYG